MANNSISTTTILDILKQPKINWEQTLFDIITLFDCQTGTLHFLEKDTDLLQLKVQKGIPDFLIPKLSTIPIGKGMAGIAAERRKPVEMCNLQTDGSGVARPAAKETKVEGSIAVPMLLDGELFGVFGIAKTVSYDFTDLEEKDLLQLGEAMCRAVAKQ